MRGLIPLSSLLLGTASGIGLEGQEFSVLVQELTSVGLSHGTLKTLSHAELDKELEVYGDESAESIVKKATQLEWERALKLSQDGSYEMPLVLCHSESEQSGSSRLSHLNSILRRAGVFDDVYFQGDDAHVAYNHDDMTCVLSRLPVKHAVEAALSGEEFITVQPHLSFSKMVGGSVNKMHDLYGDEDQQDESGDASSSSTISPKVRVLMCKGAVTEEQIEDADFDVAQHHATLVKDMLLERFEDGSSYVRQVIFNGFHNATFDFDGGEENNESRRKFWSEVFEKSFDAPDGICDILIEKIEVEFDAESHIMSFALPILTEKGFGVPERDGDKAAGKEFIVDEGLAKQLHENRRWCGLALLAGISLSNNACFIDVEARRKKYNVNAAWIAQSGKRDEFPFYDVGLTGTGEVIAVSDTGIDMQNCYFRDAANNLKFDGSIDLTQRKVVQYVPFVDQYEVRLDHGTHVAGTLAGRKSLNGINGTKGMADGMAYGAKIALFDIGAPDDSIETPAALTTLLDVGVEAGARVHCSSWGTDDPNYGIDARFFDMYSYNMEDFLIMNAGGNEGTFLTVGDPGTAKNILAVGASHSFGRDLEPGMRGPDFVAEYSGRGPTSDGRTKPDIIAPGEYILSAGARPDMPGACDPPDYPEPDDYDEGVMSSGGTSMSAPVVTGAAAIIRQYFAEGWYPDGVKNVSRAYNPTGAAVKAIILNGGQAFSGVDLGGGRIFPTRPYDPISNYGLISLVNSLYLPGNKSNVQMEMWDRQSIQSGQTLFYNVTIGSAPDCPTKDMSVTLVWTDPPSLPGCSRCLMNDLDLYVERVGDGKGFFPNGLDGPDNLNNNERVRVTAKKGDEFRFRVSGKNLVTEQQAFALVATGCLFDTTAEVPVSSNGTGISSNSTEVPVSSNGIEIGNITEDVDEVPIEISSSQSRIWRTAQSRAYSKPTPNNDGGSPGSRATLMQTVAVEVVLAAVGGMLVLVGDAWFS